MTTPVIVVETITPGVAQSYLELNVNNRRIKKAHVERLARDMATGNWVFDGTPIRFNGSELIDGQHRMLAIIASGQPQQFVVIRDIPCAAKDVIDTGVSRSVADVAELAGIARANKVTGAARTYLAWRDGLLGLTAGGAWLRRYTTHHIVTFVRDNDDALQIAVRMTESTYSSLGGSHVAYSAFAFRAMEVDPDVTISFFADLASGAMLGDDDPVFAMRRYVIQRLANRQRVGSGEYVATLMKAWSARRAKQPVKLIRLTSVERDANVVPWLE